MSLSTQHIVRHLFRVESLEEVSRQQLEELVATHPSFGVGRYLLSRKLQAESADNFAEETQKTNLYFTNPFWLQWLLQDAKAAPVNGVVGAMEETEVAKAEETEEVGTAPVEVVEEGTAEPVEEVGTGLAESVEEVREAQPGASEPSAADELLKSIAALQEQRKEAQQTEHKEEVSEEPSQPMSIAGLALEQLEEKEQPAVVKHTADRHAVEDIHFVERNPAEDTVELAPGEMEEAGEDGKPVWETEEGTVVEEAAPEQEMRPEVEEIRSNVEEPVVEVSAAVVEEQPVAEASAPVVEEQPVAEASAAVAEAGAAVEEVKEVTAEVRTEEKPVEEAAVFEPYHTVDYFASQGIRLVLDDNPTDRLGQQLKSFTDWLKIMRRLPQKNREIIPDIAAEHHVQAIAAHSIERKEIVTETMAEVLAKQGMREKAMEMYRKLSLLEPGKSAYFAEKIEKLKII